MTDYDSASGDEFLAPPRPSAERPPALAWRFVSVPLIAWAAFALLSLAAVLLFALPA